MATENDKRVHLQVKVTPEIRKKLKILSVKRDKSMGEVLEQLIRAEADRLGITEIFMTADHPNRAKIPPVKGSG